MGSRTSVTSVPGRLEVDAANVCRRIGEPTEASHHVAGKKRSGKRTQKQKRMSEEHIKDYRRHC